MNTILWLCQGFLALAFGYSGICKSVLSQDKLVAIGQTGAGEVSITTSRFIGIAELLGTAGVILPWGLNVLPWLTPVAAMGFAIIMLLAAPIHYRLHEPKNVFTNVVLLLVSIMVIWGRTAELLH